MDELAPAHVPGGIFLMRSSGMILDAATLFSDIDQDLQLTPEVNAWCFDNLSSKIVVVRGLDSSLRHGYWLLFNSVNDRVLFALRWL